MMACQGQKEKVNKYLAFDSIKLSGRGEGKLFTDFLLLTCELLAYESKGENS